MMTGLEGVGWDMFERDPTRGDDQCKEGKRKACLTTGLLKVW